VANPTKKGRDTGLIRTSTGGGQTGGGRGWFRHENYFAACSLDGMMRNSPDDEKIFAAAGERL